MESTSADEFRSSLLPLRNVACVTMVLILPVSLLGQESGAAMLHTTGEVLVNKSPAPASLAIFPDALIETPKNTVARIELTGSAADINEESMVQFEADELVLDHGTVSVNSSRLFRVRIGCITVTPVNADWTHYDVTDVDGKVTVSALKSDVYIEARSKNPQALKKGESKSREIVHEGEQKSREEKCGAAGPQPDHVSAYGAILNSPYVKWPTAVAIGAIACLGLCHDDDPVSPSKPK
jgi:hypothetical protein